jgi:hypothetical protein
MKQGSWVVLAMSNLGEKARMRTVACCLAALVLGSSSFAGFDFGNGGFEVGNGMHSSKSLSGADFVSFIKSQELAEIEYGTAVEIPAPPSDGISPRTKISLSVQPLYSSAEEALDYMLKAGKGWVTFVSDQLSGVHREVLVNKLNNLSRLELHFFRDNVKYVIRLEGNKATSKVYVSLAQSLLEEIH